MDFKSHAHRLGHNQKDGKSLATIAQIASALKRANLTISPTAKKTESVNKEKPALYTDLVDEQGKDVLLSTHEHMDQFSTPEGSPGKPAPRLQSTPSMAMLCEATLALKESPSALTKMSDISSTGGVYQLRRRSKHVWEESSTDSSPSSHCSTQSATTGDKVSNGRGKLSRSNSSLNASALSRMVSSDSHKVLPLNAEGKAADKENCSFPRRKHLVRSSTERGGSAPPCHRFKREPSKLAVFKPEDEETGASKAEWTIGAPNPEREGMIVGGGARRERAAYVLDKMYGGFSGVPPTALIKVPAEVKNSVQGFKRGSLQKYCPSDGSAEDKPALVRLASPEEVQKIAVLDFRIFNTDRHAGNILVQKRKGRDCQDEVILIPIDHALSLPDWRFLGEAYFDWEFWEQSETPFTEDVMKLIDSLDIEKDAEALREIDVAEASIATYKICTVALKVAARNGLTPRELSRVFQRPFPPGHDQHNSYLSPLEQMIKEGCYRVGYKYRKSKTEVNASGFIAEKSNDLSRLASSLQISDSFEEKSTSGESSSAESQEELSYTSSFDSKVLPTESALKAIYAVFQEEFTDGKWERWLPQVV